MTSVMPCHALSPDLFVLSCPVVSCPVTDPLRKLCYNQFEVKMLDIWHRKESIPHSPRFNFTKSSPFIFMFYPKYLFQSYFIDFSDRLLEVRFLSPTLAVQTGYWNNDGLETEREKKRKDGMWTCVLEKIDGKWLYLIRRGWPKQPE